VGYNPNCTYKHTVELGVRTEASAGVFSREKTVCVIYLSDEGVYSIYVHCYTTDSDYTMTLS